jgi:hypothetical protein
MADFHISGVESGFNFHISGVESRFFILVVLNLKKKKYYGKAYAV